MSRWFPDSETSLLTGMCFAGRKDLYEVGHRSVQQIVDAGDAKFVDGNISQFGESHPGCTMIGFDNPDGISVRVASTKFRGGFDCWLTDPTTGYCVRV